MALFRFVRRHSRLLALLFLALLIPVAYTAVRGAMLIRELDEAPLHRAATLYDAGGGLLATLGDRRGAFVALEELPRHLKEAVIAVEDARFYRHRGIDVIGIVRALLVNLREGRRAQGASTLTQQLAKNLFLTPEKSYVRKFQEAIYALLLEVRYSKERILELYLNQVYFGEGAYGVDEAARTYFGKPASQLTLAESALLAGVLRAPSAYSPHRNLETALARRDIALGRMEELGYIDSETRREAAEEPVRLAARRGGNAPYFVDYVRSWLVDRFGARTVFEGGLRVMTSLDPQVQKAAEEALASVPSQGAIVAVDPASGGIRAMVGGRDYVESQFNRATQSRRQPGSAFKPFVYAAALERGWQMNDLVEDVPRAFGDYAPRNFRNEYWGPVTMKHALVESLNVASVWLLQQIGVDAAVEMATRLGITTLTPEDRHLALALGGLARGVSPLEMAAAYVPFANGGFRYDPVAVLEVQDGDGRLLFRHRPRPRRVLSEEVAYFVTDMLQEAVWRGTGAAANIGRPQAGKTGTTDNLLNAWFIGYTPDFVASVYLGHDTPAPLTGGGGSLAAPVWGRMMASALRGREVRAFTPPPFVVTGIPVDIFTGLRADAGCPFREFDSFVRGREPFAPSPCTRGIAQRGGPDIAPSPADFDGDASAAEAEEESPPAPHIEVAEPPPGATEPRAGASPPGPAEGPRLERAFPNLGGEVRYER